MEKFLRFLRRTPKPVRVAALLAVYVAAGVGLERVADLPRQTWQAQPWDPAAGLHVALLLAFGLRYAPVLFLVPFLDDTLFTVADNAHPFITGMTSGLSVALGYWAICAVLKYRFAIDPRLSRARDVIALSVVSLVGSLCLVVANIGVQMLLGVRVPMPFEMIMHAWAGEATGVAMLAPLLLVGLRAFPWADGTLTLKGEPNLQHLRRPSTSQLFKWAGFVGVVAAVTWAAFGGLTVAGAQLYFFSIYPGAVGGDPAGPQQSDSHHLVYQRVRRYLCKW